MSKKRNKYENYREMLAASSIGLVFLVSVLIGYAIGYWVDNRFGTKPWGSAIFMLIGVASGFRNVFIFLKQAEKIAEREQSYNEEKK